MAWHMRLLAPLFATCMAVSACSSNPERETAGQYVDDVIVTSRVKAAILNEPSLKVTQIGVETYKGQVQLSGFVATQAEINKAAEVARAVEGVRSVKNDLHLRSR